MLYKKLLLTIDQRKELEAKINLAKVKFEESIALEKALLDDILAAEEQLRKELLIEMKEKNIENEKYDGHLITKNVRSTNQIKDVRLFATAVTKNKLGIIELGVATKQLDELFKEELTITNKKLATDIINNFEKINDQLLDGCEKKITEFLTIT